MVLDEYKGIQIIEEDATPNSFGLCVYIVKGPKVRKRTFKGELGYQNAQRYWNDCVNKVVYNV